MQRVMTRRGEMAYREAGEGKPVLLIHGFPLDSRLWLDLLEAPPPGRWLIAPDLPGFGAGRPVLGNALSMRGFADDVVALLDALEIERADVVGMSMGGYVALAMAEAVPSRLRSLALVDSRSVADTDEGRAGRDAMTFRVVAEGRGVIAEQMAEALTAPGASPAVRGRIRTMIEDATYEGIIGALAGMRDRPDRTAVLSQIEVPGVVVVGSADTITPPEEGQEMASHLRDGELVVVPGAGHAAVIEQPEAVAAALEALWRRADARP